MRALLLAVALAACKPPPAPPFALRIAVSGSLASFGPEAESHGWISIIQPCVYETLVGIGTEGETVPILAARTEITAAHALRLWIRNDARFSDGSPVTFQDVADSVAAAGLHASLEAGETIVVAGDESAGPLELRLARTFISRRTPAGPLGTGPFKLVEQTASRVVLERLKSQPGLIDRVELDSYPTPQDMFAHTLKGDAELLPEVLPRWVEFFQGVPRLRVLRAPGVNANMIAFNTSRLSREERVALSHALATDEIRRQAFGDDCAPPASRPEIKPLPSGRALELLAPDLLDRFALVVRRSLGDRGNGMRVVEVATLFNLISKREYDLAAVRPAVWPPMTVAFWRTGAETNVLGYSDPAVDAAIDARDWTGAQRALAEDPPGAIVCTPPSLLVLDARIRTPPLTAGFLRSLPRWEVVQ